MAQKQISDLAFASGIAKDDEFVLRKVSDGTDYRITREESRSDLAANQGSSLVGDASGATVHDLLPIHLQFSTYADLRNYSHIQGVDIVQITGDGIAGIFKADPSDTTTADNGGTVIVAADGTRWKRQTNGAVNVQWFGAQGDGTTDDTAAFQAALATAGAGALVIPATASSYLISAGLTSNDAVTIRGIGKASIQMAASTGFTLFALSGEGATLQDLYIYGDRTANQIALNLTAPVATIANLRIERVDTGIEVSGGYYQLIDTIALRNCATYALNLTNGTGAILRNISYDTDGSWYTSGSYSMPTAGIRIAQQGTIVDQANMTHAGTGLLIDQTAASPCYFMLISNSYFDSGLTVGPGIHIRNNYSNAGTFGTMPIGLFFNNVWSATNSQGLLIDGSDGFNGIYFESCYFHNNVNEGARVAPSVTSNNIKFNNCVLAGNSTTGAGVANTLYAQNVNSIQIEGSRFGLEFWTGNVDPLSHLYLDSAVSEAVVHDNVFDTNVTGNILQTSPSGTSLRDNKGLVTENNGQATVPNGGTSVTVNHGLSLTPQISDIIIAPITGWGSGNQNFWLSNATATQFTINLSATPSNAVAFTWFARKETT